jgi:hypothetical protein
MSKKQDILVNMHSKVIEELHRIDEIITSSIKEKKKESKKEKENDILKEKDKLLMKIAERENRDLTLLRKEYLTPSELNIIEKNNSIVSIDNEQVLDKIELNGIIYYYEDKENGKVYNTKSEIVGSLKNNAICFDT